MRVNRTRNALWRSPIEGTKPMISPTVGRVVHFVPAPHDEVLFGSGVCAALVAYVHSDTMVNLAVFDTNGGSHARTSVYLEQDERTAPGGPHGSYCRWMPYQVGQAAKTESAERALNAAKAASD